MIDKDINFIQFFKLANIFSLIIFLLSIIFIIFKGLNYGIDFKGGTLIELRVDKNTTNISDIRSAFRNMDLGDVNIKEFGKKGDYLIKIEKTNENKADFIAKIKKDISLDLQTEISFRRVEKVGPKVSSELLEAGILAISLSLFAMLFYIWIIS